LATGSSMSTYLENAIIQHFLKAGAAVAQPAALYASLHSADPTDTNTAGTELSYTGYARIPVTFAVGSNGATSNTADLLWPANGSATPASVAFTGVYDALTAGNLILHSTTTAKTLAQNDQYKVAAGSLTATFD
jgi:hypothetical protein